MKTIYLLIGYFGVGKTTVVNAYPHKKILGIPCTEVGGLVSLGEERGADDLSKKGFKKREVFLNLIPALKNRDILVHSVFYTNIQDIDRYTRTHNVAVIYLKTSYQTNRERMRGRNSAKMLKPKAFDAFCRYVDKTQQFCQHIHAPFYTIDNDRPKEVIAAEVWQIINKIGDNSAVSSERVLDRQ